VVATRWRFGVENDTVWEPSVLCKSLILLVPQERKVWPSQ
jgi:hypothetical protein